MTSARKLADFLVMGSPFIAALVLGSVFIRTAEVPVGGFLTVSPESLLLIGAVGLLMVRKDADHAYPFMLMGCGLFDFVFIANAGAGALTSQDTLFQAVMLGCGWVWAKRPKLRADWSLVAMCACYLVADDLTTLAKPVAWELPLWVFEGLMWVWLYRSLPQKNDIPAGLNSPET